MSIQSNQRGFSHFIIILLVLILAILGVIGWRVWESSKTDDSATPSASSNSKKKSTDKGITTFTYVKPVSESYRVALPTGWVSGTCADNTEILFLAPTTDKLGKCSSESGGTVAVSKNSGDIGHNEEYYTSDDYFGSPVFTPITIDGITGYKVSYSVATDTELGYPPVGTQIVHYSLFDGTNTYTLTYNRFAGDPDLTATVQTLAESFDKL